MRKGRKNVLEKKTRTYLVKKLEGRTFEGRRGM